MIREAWNGKTTAYYNKQTKRNEEELKKIINVIVVIFFTSLKRVWVESGKNKQHKIRRIMSVPWPPLFGVTVSIYDPYERWKHYGQLRVVIISIQALQWAEKTAMIVLNKEFLLFNRCNQSSISTPGPFFTDPRVHVGQFDLTWVGALSSCSGDCLEEAL